jgi:hypothetical protein
MADDPKSKEEPKEVPSSAALSPAPTVVAGAKKDESAPAGEQKVQATPLSDGTTPTVLNAGASHRTVPKGKASITGVYRKADIMTTLLTFGGAVVAGAIIIGAYTFLTKPKNQATPTPKVTSLDKTEIDKLTSFFEGNSAGNNAEILTISSSSLFKNRVAMSNDLKVVGATEVSGTTTLGDLTVNKTSTLGVTNVRGALSVSGPLVVQSSSIFTSGVTINGNVASTGNGTFGGSVAANTINSQNLTVSGQININGHINFGGQNPTASAASGISSGASVNGNDSAGSVSVTVLPTAGQPGGAAIVTVNFRQAFPNVPTVIITPVGRGAALLEPYITATATGFSVGSAILPAHAGATNYTFNYWVVQ